MGVQINGSEGNVIATQGTFSGDVGIGGTLTYEDVTNIDSVGLITARTGIEIGARPGVAASISVDGNMIVSGISTFGGDVQVPDKIIHSGDTNTAIRFPEADTVTVETGGSERLRIKSDGTSYVLGDFGVGTNSPQSSGLTVENSSEARLRVRAGSNASNGEVALRADGVNTQLGTWSDHDLKLVRNTTEVASLNANGIAFPSGKGIDFSATGGPTNGSGSSELLDDYEEGSFTPEIRFGGGNTGQSYASQMGRYTKIGNRVVFHLYVKFSNKGTASGNAHIYGLPFTAANISVGYAHCSAWMNQGNFGETVPTGYIPPSQTYYNIERQRCDNGLGVSSCDNTNFNNTTDMMVGGSYITTA